MEMIKTYQGYQKNIFSNGKTVTQTYKGYKEDCEQFITKYKIGQMSDDGVLKNINLTQAEGPYWTVTLQWSIEVDGFGNSSPAGSSYGPKSSTLTVRMLSLPLEKAKNYRTHWNYYLAYFGSPNDKITQDKVPQWWYTSRSVRVPDGVTNFMWVHSQNELPQKKENGKSWRLVVDKTKQGIESWSYPVYELTETSKHNKQEQAGWTISQKSGKIDFPDNGDFGIVAKIGGNWLCEGGSISYDGKYWIASRTYVHSPDGWDEDLYKHVSEV